jgi:nucleotide-binding universal stress UspA family protein
MHRYREMAVGLDRSETDAALVPYAAMVARLGTATAVHFVHVLPRTTDAATVSGYDRVIADLQAQVRPEFHDVPAQQSFDVLSGPLTDRLLSHVAEKEVDLLMVGHGRNRPGRSALARRLAMKAPCSVWMVPEGSRTGINRILVPIDFSENAADAMRVAVSLARLSGAAECLALHVYFNEAVVTYEEYDQVLRGQEQQAYRQFMAPINCHGVQVTPLFEESAQVGHAITRAADRNEVDLIVMATRGRSRSAAILLGSVTEELIIETRRPLLAVKHFGTRLSVLQALLDRKFWQRSIHT